MIMNQYFLIQKKKKNIKRDVRMDKTKKFIFPDHFCVIARLGPVLFWFSWSLTAGLEKRERERNRKENKKMKRDKSKTISWCPSFFLLLFVCQCVCVYKFSDDGNSAVWWIKNQRSRNPFPRMAKLSKVSFTTFVI